jgi:5-methylcytosine-specific restriction endonuclease McrA
MKIEEYIKQEYARVKKNLYKSERKTFGSADKLAAWFVGKLKDQNFSCFYCESSIFDINKLIDAGLLKTRAVRGEGRRGPVLEIDKNDDTYVPENCVLSCYYCNNDKSYTSSKEDYKDYFGKNRHQYFKTLLDKLNNASLKS